MIDMGAEGSGRESKFDAARGLGVSPTTAAGVSGANAGSPKHNSYHRLVRPPARTHLQIGYLTAPAWQSSGAHLDDDIYNFATTAQLKKKFMIKGVNMMG